MWGLPWKMGRCVVWICQEKKNKTGCILPCPVCLWFNPLWDPLVIYYPGGILLDSHFQCGDRCALHLNEAGAQHSALLRRNAAVPLRKKITCTLCEKHPPVSAVPDNGFQMHLRHLVLFAACYLWAEWTCCLCRSVGRGVARSGALSEDTEPSEWQEAVQVSVAIVLGGVLECKGKGVISGGAWCHWLEITSYKCLACHLYVLFCFCCFF